MTGIAGMVYTEAYQATGNHEFKRIACEIFTYVQRDMTSRRGDSILAKMQIATEWRDNSMSGQRHEIDSVLGEESQLIKKVFWHS